MEAEPYMYLGRWDEVVRVAEGDLALAWDIGEWDAVFWVSAWLGIALVKLGRVDEARRVVERALAEADARAIMQWQIAFLYIALAHIRLAEGESEPALDAARRRSRSPRRRARHSSWAPRTGSSAKPSPRPGSPRRPRRRSAPALTCSSRSNPDQKLAQTPLAYGRFPRAHDPPAADALLARALSIVEAIGAESWADEARIASQ